MSKNNFPRVCILLALITLPFFFSKAFAQIGTTYYVDCDTGVNTRDGKSQATAWKSLNSLSQRSINPGDTILFKKGCTWTGDWTGLHIDRAGTQSAPITISSYGTATTPPTFRASSTNWSSGIQVDEQWIVVDGLATTQSIDAGVYLTEKANNTVVRNMQISNAGVGIAINSNGNKIYQNEIKDLHLITNTPGGDDDFGAVGFKIFGSNNEIYKNRITNAIGTSYDYGTDGGGFEFWSQDGRIVENNTLYYNWVQDSNGFVEIGARNGETIRNTMFAYNIGVNNGAVGTFHLKGGNSNFGATIQQLQLYNNTFYEVSSALNNKSNRDPSMSIIWFSTKPSTTTAVMKNNVFWAEGFTHFAYSNQVDGYEHTHNLYYLPNSAQTTFPFPLHSTEKVGVNPLFTNTQQFDFTPTQGSPLIDAGTTLPASLQAKFTTDYLNQLSPADGEGNGTAITDIGAIERQADLQPTITSTVSPTLPVAEKCNPADINANNVVDLTDYSILVDDFLKSPPTYPRSNINKKGEVDLYDYSILVREFFATTTNCTPDE